jgi:hypothetical protein
MSNEKPMTSLGLEPATLPACSILPQPTTLPRAAVIMDVETENEDIFKAALN